MVSYKEKIIRAAALLLAASEGKSGEEDWTRVNTLVEELTEDPEEFLRENREAISQESRRLRLWADVDSLRWRERRGRVIESKFSRRKL